MGNLISGIQHFFITTFATIATVVVVALPFHKPPVHPTPSPKQEVQVKKETTPSINPSPTNHETQSVSQSSNTSAVIPSPAAVLVDCTGPDEKIIKLTQKQCDDFNTAWNKPPTVQSQNTTTNSQVKNTNGYVNTSSNTNSANGSYYYPNYIFPTYPPINTGGSQPIPVNTPVPVDHSLDLQICLSNEESNWQSIMEQLNRRGVWYSGEADQARNDHAARVQSCHQQYGN